MNVVQLSSSKESSGRGGREFASGGGRPSSPRAISETTISLHVGGVDVDDEGEVLVDCLSIIRGYDWASHEVGSYTLCFQKKEDLEWWANRSCVVRDGKDVALIWLTISKVNKQVYHGKGGSPKDFFFVCPARAECCSHPTAFERLDVYASFHGGMFFLGDNPHNPCFPSLLSRFKTKYFKVVIRKSGRSEFVDEAGFPLFPFHWIRDPRKVASWPPGSMTPDKVEAVRIIKGLPRRLCARSLIECLYHEEFDEQAFGIMFVSLLESAISLLQGRRWAACHRRFETLDWPPTPLMTTTRVEVPQSAPLVDLE
ncbi:hypothetical protein LR48_Vigan511s010900 [Vigna angularis]|uniref:Uncharacterized protein n=1 Tax=Phaseolus angularis TaxID=3914 RepID=A0A0L9TD11_PHAAN|nr:hypothetical protein LR48_Vigan511s010900 [Vigna angularis]